MKILIVCLSLNNGGTERVIANLANYFSDYYSVDILKVLKSNNYYDINENVSIHEIDEKEYYKKSKISKVFAKISIKRLLEIRKFINSEKPDIILSFLPLPSFYIMILKRISSTIKKIPVILSERGDPNITYKNKFLYIMMKFLYKNANGFVFQTEEAKKYYEGIIKCKSKIICNPINPCFIKKDYSHNRNNNIVSVGRLEKQKNFFLLIDSFELLYEEYPEYQLLIYGTGSMEQELKKYIERKNLKQSIFLMGKSNKLYNEIYDSKMFVLSSDYEGMPNALLEAMSLGLPCIATDCPVGGPRMIINNNTSGILVEIKNKKQLYEAMKKIIENNKISDELSKNAIKEIKKYHPIIINKEWDEWVNYIYKGESKKYK